MADAHRILFVGTAAALGLGAASNAYATGPSVNITKVPDLGTVVSGASGNTVFTIDPGTGAVTVASGTGGRPTLSSNGAAYGEVTVSCGALCSHSDLHVQIRSTGFNINRGRGISDFTVSVVTGTVDTHASGASGGADDPYDLYIKSPGNATIKFGGKFTIAGADSGSATGVAQSTFQVSAIASNNNVTQGLAAKATVGQGLAISSTGSLNFGLVLLPATQAVIDVDADNGDYHNTGVTTLPVAGAPSRPQFTLTGASNTNVAINVPSQLILHNPKGSSLTVAVSNNAGSSRSLGSSGTFTFGVGGSIFLTSATPTGVYTGTIVVSANYN
jgi:hypothetical protein